MYVRFLMIVSESLISGDILNVVRFFMKVNFKMIMNIYGDKLR